MRTLIVTTLVCLGFLAAADTAAADSYVVGDCDKFGGACAGVCIEDGDTTCWDDSAACVGFSHQVPQCVDASASSTTQTSSSPVQDIHAGSCSSFCINVCFDGDADCGRYLACFGVSYQMPVCVKQLS